MRQTLAITLAGALLASFAAGTTGAYAAGIRMDTSACFKMTSFRASNGKTYRVKMPRGQACFDREFGIRGGAHIANATGGENPWGAIQAARSMNRRNVVFVVNGTCQSSCWIQWNFMDRKCWAGSRAPTFRQHARTATGRKINPHSRSRAYWIKAGREGPGGTWTQWTPSNDYRCSETVMSMHSTSGNTSRSGRASFRHDRGRTPGKFMVRSQH